MQEAFSLFHLLMLYSLLSCGNGWGSRDQEQLRSWCRGSQALWKAAFFFQNGSLKRFSKAPFFSHLGKCLILVEAPSNHTLHRRRHSAVSGAVTEPLLPAAPTSLQWAVAQSQENFPNPPSRTGLWILPAHPGCSASYHLGTFTDIAWVEHYGVLLYIMYFPARLLPRGNIVSEIHTFVWVGPYFW